MLMVARLRAPGFYRSGVGMVLGLGFAMFLTWVVRMSYGHGTYRHFFDPTAWVTLSLISVPFGFLIGLGAFDYWFYWALGKPTRAEDHSSHGARSWKDYFRVNTDHR